MFQIVLFRYCTDEQGRSAIEIVKASGGLPEMIAVLSGTKSLGVPKPSMSASSSSPASSPSAGAATAAGMNSNLATSVVSGVAAPLKLGEEKEKRFKKNKKKDKIAAGVNTGKFVVYVVICFLTL